MTVPRAILACLAVLLAAIASPATAGEQRHEISALDIDAWRAVHAGIYEGENLIALLEANPHTDDGYKAPIIGRARADIGRLNATLPRPQWRWTNPCCYSRSPIYIH